MASILWNALKESFKLIREHKANVALIMLFDIFFLFVSFLTWIFVSRGIATSYTTLLQQNANLELESVSQESLQVLSQQLEVMQAAANKILFLLILTGVLIFAYYGFFKGLNWLITRNMLDNRHIFSDFNGKYAGKFYLISLFWALIFIIFILEFGGSVLQQLYYGWGLGHNLIFLIFSFLFFYFMSISFAAFLLKNKAVKGIKDAFILGVKRFYVFIPLFLVVILVGYIIGLVVSLLAKINVIWWLTSVIGIFLALLIIAWGRLYVLLVVKKYV